MLDDEDARIPDVPAEWHDFVDRLGGATSRSTQSVIDNLEMDVAASRGEESIHLATQQVDPADVALGDAEAVLADVLKSLTDTGAAATGEVTSEPPARDRRGHRRGQVHRRGHRRR